MSFLDADSSQKRYCPVKKPQEGVSIYWLAILYMMRVELDPGLTNAALEKIPKFQRCPSLSALLGGSLTVHMVQHTLPTTGTPVSVNKQRKSLLG